jgi:hypothetical protein
MVPAETGNVNEDQLKIPLWTTTGWDHCGESTWTGAAFVEVICGGLLVGVPGRRVQGK